jgi:hypothetical protein
MQQVEYYYNAHVKFAQRGRKSSFCNNIKIIITIINSINIDTEHNTQQSHNAEARRR